ncbi:MAG TPA: aldo/keto reductase [Caulobacterales bacterium]|nr:aldo/keto reductase [Caulobacterales bacterium]
MHSRTFHGGRRVSEIGLGAWQLGGADWGDMPAARALDILDAAADAGVTFIDTADVYGLGRSEQLIGQWLARSDRDRFFIATKIGRFPKPGWPENFTAAMVRAHVDACRQRLGLDALDLVQLHCVPTDALKHGEMFDALRKLKSEGKIKAFGASVETTEQALLCLNIDGIASLQIIFNILRQPMNIRVLPEAKAKGVSLIVRLPLASGLLSGKMSAEQRFPENDHRNYNRDGEAFYVGETFNGLTLAKGVELADRVAPFAPKGLSMTQFALRWCLDHEAVTTVIPGARSPDQARANAAVSGLAPLERATHARLRAFYASEVAPHIRGGV